MGTHNPTHCYNLVSEYGWETMWLFPNVKGIIYQGCMVHLLFPPNICWERKDYIKTDNIKINQKDRLNEKNM